MFYATILSTIDFLQSNIISIALGKHTRQVYIVFVPDWSIRTLKISLVSLQLQLIQCHLEQRNVNQINHDVL